MMMMARSLPSRLSLEASWREMERAPRAERLGMSTTKRGASEKRAVAFVIWVVAAGWCVVAWGAFRQAFAATHLQAAGATAIWLGVLGGLMALGQRLS